MGTLCESKAGFILLCIGMMRLLQRCLKILIQDAGGSFKHKLNSCDFVPWWILQYSLRIVDFRKYHFLFSPFWGEMVNPSSNPRSVSLFPPDFRDLCERRVRRPHCQREAVNMEPAGNRRLSRPPLCQLHLILERWTHVQRSAAQIQVTGWTAGKPFKVVSGYKVWIQNGVTGFFSQ